MPQGIPRITGRNCCLCPRYLQWTSRGLTRRNCVNFVGIRFRGTPRAYFYNYVHSSARTVVRGPWRNTLHNGTVLLIIKNTLKYVTIILIWKLQLPFVKFVGQAGEFLLAEFSILFASLEAVLLQVTKHSKKTYQFRF